MSLILLSGRPGAGKTFYAERLAEDGFVAVQTDVQPQWHNALCGVQTFEQAVQLRNVVRSLGSDVVVEWGYPPAVLPSVRLLHNAGIEAWWLDGDPAELLEGYKRRWKPPVDPMEVGQPYRTQKDRIDAAWPKLERFYGSRILRTAEAGSELMGYPRFRTAILGGSA